MPRSPFSKLFIRSALESGKVLTEGLVNVDIRLDGEDIGEESNYVGQFQEGWAAWLGCPQRTTPAMNT